MDKISGDKKVNVKDRIAYLEQQQELKLASLKENFRELQHTIEPKMIVRNILLHSVRKVRSVIHGFKK